MQQIFPMAAPGPATKNTTMAIFLFVVVGCLGSMIAVPGGGGVHWITILVTAPILALVYRSIAKIGKVTFEVGGGVLDIRGDFLRHKIALKDVRLAEAQRIDRKTAPEVSPRERMAGTMMPGYMGGWFQMTGRGKGLVYVTDWSKAIYLPTNLGYPILLTPDDPQAFLDAIQSNPQS
ncbi:hypothetical protein CCAX7_27790 [Capsulimonas corticalis]|uniref:Bacterial Pleckstrin homology domain-containing protein n=1 Tax=Capsulimonas corticalis TaxID=2219043 RepID=A0A402CTH2_9BACT|nr:PH domain-containing protein [Capsulimonas corticalis]BDI30728.1 hypothetical protein CCAX7_27790 [Capsulimonas corticalis]